MKKNQLLRQCVFILLYLWVALAASFSLLSEELESRGLPHRVPETTSTVVIDGVLDEAEWRGALMLELNYEVEPGENIKPLVKTEVFLAYSSDHLYAAFRAYDTNCTEIRARYTDRDNIWEDDYVGVVLDTFNDSRVTYNFYCNPLGIQAEKVINISGGEIQWDAIWDSAGRITNEGYVVEMAIPFSALRFQRQKGDQEWGIDFIRSYPRNLSHLIGLFPRDRDNNCYMCQADKGIGFKGAKPGKNIELDPTLAAVLTQERESFPEGDFASTTRQVDPGLSARWRFTPNLTLSAAVNPDFSNVEADTAQLDVNNQFVLYYPEKRPFFLEDADIFRSFYNVVYTRRITNPDWGVKLTGKEGGNSIGFFSVQDSQSSFVFPWSQGSRSALINMRNFSTVMRYRRDVGKSSSLGVLITDREGDDYFNRVVGIDGRLRLTRKDRVVFQWLNSWTHYPDQVAMTYGQSLGNLEGGAQAFLYQHATQKYGLTINYQRVTPGYRADLGTNAQVDFKYLQGRMRYSFRRNPGHWFTNLSLYAGYTREYDLADSPLYKDIRFQVVYAGPVQSFLNSIVNIGKRWYMGHEFDEVYVSIDAGLRPSASFYAGVKGVVGDRVDYANIQQGRRVRVNPIIEYRWGRHLTLGVDHVYERLNVDAGRLYTANLSNFRMVYQLNRRTFLRTVLQYANYNRNSGLYSFEIEPRYRHLFSQILFSYKINPQTVLFLGYSDDYYGYQHMPITQSNRTFFLKIGYALVL